LERKRACKLNNFEAKRSGLETLDDIGMAMCMIGGRLANEVRLQLRGNGVLTRAIRSIIAVLTADERQRIWYTPDIDNLSNFSEEMRQLQQLGECYGLFQGLSKVFIKIIDKEDWKESGYELSASEGEDSDMDSEEEE
jgi:hypothetical protein